MSNIYADIIYRSKVAHDCFGYFSQRIFLRLTKIGKTDFTVCFIAFLYINPVIAQSSCPTVPPIQYNIVAEPRYDQARRAEQIVDEAANKRNFERLRNLRQYISIIAALSDKSVRGDNSAINCLDASFDEWARGNALLGDAPTPQSEYERFWALDAIALGAFKLRHAGRSLSPSTLEWLQRLADRVKQEQIRRNSGNNLSIWAALGVGTVATLAERPDLWEWSIERVNRFLNTTSTDGVLPTELVRGERATGYHFFAALPLMIFDRVARCHGLPLDQKASESLNRLISLLQKIEAGDQAIQNLSGAQQLLVPPQRWFRLLTQHQYYSLLPDDRVLKVGGSVSLLLKTLRC